MSPVIDEVLVLFLRCRKTCPQLLILFQFVVLFLYLRTRRPNG
jgi:hypothetical protein